ncbi:hypothetical protein B0H11DRAFT_1936228 [Mycena galericulata]|nr:hypothetical protein B0H11DRAFT_1936228 [Mycena galericulata]
MHENESSSEPDYPGLTDPSDYPEEESDEEEEEEESGPFGSDRALLRGPEDRLEAQRVVDSLVEGVWDATPSLAPGTEHRAELVKQRYLGLHNTGAWKGQEAWEVDGLIGEISSFRDTTGLTSLSDRLIDTLTWLVDNSEASRDPSKRMCAASARQLRNELVLVLVENTPTCTDQHAVWICRLKQHTSFLIEFFELDKNASERLLYSFPEVVVLINAAWSPAGRGISCCSQILQQTLLWVLFWLSGARSSLVLSTSHYPKDYTLYCHWVLTRIATGLRLMVDLIAFKNHHKPGEELRVTLQFDSGQDESLARFDIVFIFVALALVRGAFKDKRYCSFSHVLNRLPGEERLTNIEWDDDWKRRPVFCASGPRGASMQPDHPLTAAGAGPFKHIDAFRPFRRATITRLVHTLGTDVMKQIVGHSARSNVALDTYAVVTPSMDLTAGILYGESDPGFSAVPSVNPALFKVEGFKPTFLTREQAIAKSEHLAKVHRFYLEWSLLVCGAPDLTSVDDLPPHLTNWTQDGDLLPSRFLDGLATALEEGTGQLQALAAIHAYVHRNFKAVLQQTRKTAAELELTEVSLKQKLTREQVLERKALIQQEFEVVLRGESEKEPNAIALHVETPSSEDARVAATLDDGNDGMWAGKSFIDAVLALDVWGKLQKLRHHQNSSVHWYEIVGEKELEVQMAKYKIDSLTAATVYHSYRKELVDAGERRLKTQVLSEEEEEFVAERTSGARQCPRCARLCSCNWKLATHMHSAHTTNPLLETVLPTGPGVDDNLWINPTPTAPLLLDSDAPLLMDCDVLMGDPPMFFLA